MRRWRSATSSIVADGIDILVDLSGHTSDNRLLTFARKPAPVQASWIGYPGTTGLDAMDYYVADRHFLPPGEFESQFTEKLVYLPAHAAFQPHKSVWNQTRSTLPLSSSLDRSLRCMRLQVRGVPKQRVRAITSRAKALR